MVLPHAITAFLAMCLVFVAFGMEDISVGKADFSMTPDAPQVHSDQLAQASGSAKTKGFLAGTSEAEAVLKYYAADRSGGGATKEVEDAEGADGVERPAAEEGAVSVEGPAVDEGAAGVEALATNEVGAAGDKGTLAPPLSAESLMSEDSITLDAKQPKPTEQPRVSTESNPQLQTDSQLADNHTVEPHVSDPEAVDTRSQPMGMVSVLMETNTSATDQSAVSHQSGPNTLEGGDENWNEELVYQVKSWEEDNGLHVIVEVVGKSITMQLFNVETKHRDSLAWPMGKPGMDLSSASDPKMVVLKGLMRDIVADAVGARAPKPGAGPQSRERETQSRERKSKAGSRRPKPGAGRSNPGAEAQTREQKPKPGSGRPKAGSGIPKTGAEAQTREQEAQRLQREPKAGSGKLKPRSGAVKSGAAPLRRAEIRTEVTLKEFDYAITTREYKRFAFQIVESEVLVTMKVKPDAIKMIIGSEDPTSLAWPDGLDLTCSEADLIHILQKYMPGCTNVKKVAGPWHA